MLLSQFVGQCLEPSLDFALFGRLWDRRELVAGYNLGGDG